MSGKASRPRISVRGAASTPTSTPSWERLATGSCGASTGRRRDGFALDEVMRTTIAIEAAVLILGLDTDFYREVSAIVVFPTTILSRGPHEGPVPGTLSDDVEALLGRPTTGRVRSSSRGTRWSTPPAIRVGATTSCSTSSRTRSTCSTRWSTALPRSRQGAAGAVDRGLHRRVRRVCAPASRAHRSTRTVASHRPSSSRSRPRHSSMPRSSSKRTNPTCTTCSATSTVRTPQHGPSHRRAGSRLITDHGQFVAMIEITKNVLKIMWPTVPGPRRRRARREDAEHQTNRRAHDDARRVGAPETGREVVRTEQHGLDHDCRVQREALRERAQQQPAKGELLDERRQHDRRDRELEDGERAQRVVAVAQRAIEALERFVVAPRRARNHRGDGAEKPDQQSPPHVGAAHAPAEIGDEASRPVAATHQHTRGADAAVDRDVEEHNGDRRADVGVIDEERREDLPEDHAQRDADDTPHPTDEGEGRGGPAGSSAAGETCPVHALPSHQRTGAVFHGSGYQPGATPGGASTCGVHCVPSHHRDAPAPHGSGYQPLGAPTVTASQLDVTVDATPAVGVRCPRSQMRVGSTSTWRRPRARAGGTATASAAATRSGSAPRTSARACRRAGRGRAPRPLSRRCNVVGRPRRRPRPRPRSRRAHRRAGIRAPVGGPVRPRRPAQGLPPPRRAPPRDRECASAGAHASPTGRGRRRDGRPARRARAPAPRRGERGASSSWSKSRNATSTGRRRRTSTRCSTASVPTSTPIPPASTILRGRRRVDLDHRRAGKQRRELFAHPGDSRAQHPQPGAAAVGAHVGPGDGHRPDRGRRIGRADPTPARRRDPSARAAGRSRTRAAEPAPAG